jgi:hypothetical protein
LDSSTRKASSTFNQPLYSSRRAMVISDGHGGSINNNNNINNY